MITTGWFSCATVLPELDIEERMLDVKRRYGFYPQEKWDAHIGLRRYFEEKMGRDVYEVCEKETYDPKKC